MNARRRGFANSRSAFDSPNPGGPGHPSAAWRHVPRRVRTSIKPLTDALGVTDVLRKRLEPWAARRNRSDDANLRLLASFLLEEDSSCVDVGSHDGSFLVEALRVAPLGRHIAYEPIPEKAIALGLRFPQVDVRQKALSNFVGESSFFHVTSAPGLSGLRKRAYPGPQQVSEIKVAVERLDESLPDGLVPSLIKIDVEGGELQVLQGAANTIRRHHPVIAFEHGIGGADYYGTKPSDLFLFVREDLGLRIFDIDGNGPYSLGQFHDMFALPDLWNFVAHR
jgi:FkbM family methyltransferase